MSEPIAETPVLPQVPVTPEPSLQLLYSADLQRQLYDYLSGLARKANSAFDPDGSTPMTGNLDMGGFDIINLDDITGDLATFVTVAAGAIPDVEAAINGKQPADTTLTALAAYNTNGLLTQTAADTFTGRTILGTANEITVGDGSGVAGNPTISLPTALTFTGKTVTGGTFTGITDIAVADGGTGRSSHTAYAVITGGTTGTGAQQSIASVGTSGQVLTSNGAGALPSFQTVTVPVAATQAEQEAASSTAAFTSPGRQHFHPSAAKFWAYISQSGTTPTLQTSYNVTSITDTALGRLTVTIATDFSTANWSGQSTIDSLSAEFSNMASKAAGSAIIQSFAVSGALADPDNGWNIVGFGDHA